MNQEQIISNLISNSILMTAHLANEVCIQTNGVSIIPETDYLYIVKEFQVRLAKRIIPVKSQDDVKDEARKFITELLSKLTKGVEDESFVGVPNSVESNTVDK
jgi:hypothetical protein